MISVNLKSLKPKLKNNINNFFNKIEIVLWYIISVK